MAVQFKLTKSNGLTRRITFQTRPTWPVLSGRIANLYNIAIENVAASYIDSDGDDVTLSSDEELQDFYMSVFVTDLGVAKLAVHDLSNIRTDNLALQPLPSATPQQPSFRNTFGGHEVLPLVFEAEDEWQRLPGSLGSLFLSRDAPESPHAFVEVLESDVSVSRPAAVESGGGNASRSDVTFSSKAVQNNGKGRGRAATVEDDVSSAGSVIGDEVPAKPPVHVFDMSSEDIFGLSPRSTVKLPRSGVATPAQAQSTPVLPEQSLEADVSVHTEERKTETLDDDPPLPSLDLPDPGHVPPSLAHDVATLLTTISTVIATHPELSAGLRNIVVNTTNGNYWAAHRDAISRAAENLHRTAVQETGRSLEELRRAAEQEAGARVTEALGRIFSTVGGFTQSGQDDTGSRPSRTPAQVPPNGATSDVPRSPPVVPIPHLPPHPRRGHHSWFNHPPFTPPMWGGMGHPPPPPPPPPPPFHPRGWPRPPPPRFWGRDPECPESATSARDARAAAAELLATAAEARVRSAEERAEATTTQLSTTPEVTADELRAEVERAKADYRTRKERYRQAKSIRKMAEQRRREQESTSESLSRQTSVNPTQVTPEQSGPTVVAATPTPERQGAESSTAISEVHIVSNARGPYPQLEMFSVPKYNHTGHMHRGHIQENRENRPFNRIMRKLSDMGFTESTYANLTGKVMDQLLSHPPVSKDAEDDIVTNLIEELVSNGGGANAGGSGGIPGAWH